MRYHHPMTLKAARKETARNIRYIRQYMKTDKRLGHDTSHWETRLEELRNTADLLIGITKFETLIRSL